MTVDVPSHYPGAAILALIYSYFALLILSPIALVLGLISMVQSKLNISVLVFFSLLANIAGTIFIIVVSIKLL